MIWETHSVRYHGGSATLTSAFIMAYTTNASGWVPPTGQVPTATRYAYRQRVNWVITASILLLSLYLVR